MIVLRGFYRPNKYVEGVVLGSIGLHIVSGLSRRALRAQRRKRQGEGGAAPPPPPAAATQPAAHEVDLEAGLGRGHVASDEQVPTAPASSSSSSSPSSFSLNAAPRRFSAIKVARTSGLLLAAAVPWHVFTMRYVPSQNMALTTIARGSLFPFVFSALLFFCCFLPSLCLYWARDFHARSSVGVGRVHG
jgi:hypothetical protein